MFNAGQKYCLMQVKIIAECSMGEHSAILLTRIKLPFVIKIFILSIFSGCLRQVLLYLITCSCPWESNKFKNYPTPAKDTADELFTQLDLKI